MTDLFPGGFSLVALSVSDTVVSGGCISIVTTECYSHLPFTDHWLIKIDKHSHLTSKDTQSRLIRIVFSNIHNLIIYSRLTLWFIVKKLCGLPFKGIIKVEDLNSVAFLKQYSSQNTLLLCFLCILFFLNFLFWSYKPLRACSSLLLWSHWPVL